MRKKEKSKEDLMSITNNSVPDNLFKDIKSIIESSRTRVALSVNSEEGKNSLMLLARFDKI